MREAAPYSIRPQSWMRHASNLACCVFMVLIWCGPEEIPLVAGLALLLAVFVLYAASAKPDDREMNATLGEPTDHGPAEKFRA